MNRRESERIAVQDVVVPAFGNGFTTGTIRRWLKEPGETLAGGDLLVIIGIGGHDIEVECPFSGTLAETMADIEDRVEVGQPIARIAAS